MSLRINDTAPDFTADTTAGPISFHDWIGGFERVLPYLRKTKMPQG